MQLKSRLLLVSLLIVGTASQACANQRDSQRPMGPPNFASLDLDGSEGITLDEFKEQTLPFGEHEEVFNTIDSDKDGVITKQELTDHKPPRPPRN